MSGDFITTGIGSMPHREPLSACNLIIDSFDIPFWPQFPKLSYREYMIQQFSEGLPGIVFDGDRVFLRRNEELISEWLSNYRDENESPISQEYALGLHKMMDILKGKKIKRFKGQLTGPLTYSLSLKDEEGMPIYFDETLRELALMHLKSKALWQINFLRNFAEEIWIFIDEPILQAVGTSAYISVEQSEVKRLIDDLATFIKSHGVKVGLHCCGRADWRDVLSLNIDILSFDAFFFFDFFKIYQAEIGDFIDKGGYIAWGFVPTTDDLRSLDNQSIIESAKRKIDEIGNSIPSIFKKSILTPSCGMGSLEEEDSLRVCDLIKSLKNFLNG